MNTQHVRMAESDEAYEQVRADSRRCLPGLGSGDVYPLSVASKLKSVKKDIPRGCLHFERSLSEDQVSIV